MPTGQALVFGATSMVGSHFVDTNPQVLSVAGRNPPRGGGVSVGSFHRLSLEDTISVERLVEASPEPAVINFAANTDVDAVERERPTEGLPREEGSAWRVNVLAPEAVARATRATGRYFIQLSTDFVFDGRRGPYDEDSPRSEYSPWLSWYGWTKSEGERRVLEANPSAAVVRIAYPFRSRYTYKLDFARWLGQHRRGGALPPLYTNQRITPTWIPDVSAVLRRLLEARRSGIFHVASPEATTPYEFARTLFREAGWWDGEVREGTLDPERVAPGRAPRPVTGGLRTGRLAELRFSPTPWREALHNLVLEEGWK